MVEVMVEVMVMVMDPQCSPFTNTSTRFSCSPFPYPPCCKQYRYEVAKYRSLPILGTGGVNNWLISGKMEGKLYKSR